MNNIVIAKKSDWKTEDMPKQKSSFVIERSFTSTEMEILRSGNIPQAMEDKWFWYMEGNTLYAHRSWTGYCIHILAFMDDGKTILVTANRNPDQYSCTDDKADAVSLNKLLDWWVQPSYDYYHEWLSETLDAINKKQYSVTKDALIIDGKSVEAVYFHKPDEPNGFLNNWWKSDFVLEGVKFSSVEQCIMYRKCLLFGDTASAKQVLLTDDTAMQQKIARHANGYNDTVWSGMRQVILMRALVEKFAQNEHLYNALQNTGDAYLVECANTDKIWACGLGLNKKERKDISKWDGSNILGFALMEVRRMLKGLGENE